MKNLSVQILSVPHREKLIAEIQYDHYIIAEINQDSDELEIEMFAYDEIQFAFKLDDLIKIIIEAKRKLLEI